MDYQDVVRDFAERTRKNLEVIEKIKGQQSESEVFEVTQLINSMLGLLVFPQQRYFDSIPRTPLDELEKQGWTIPKTRENFPEARNLQDLVRLLRNAIAHFNIKFAADSPSKITGVIIWNNNREGRKTWEAELSLEDLRQITQNFIDLLQSHWDQPRRK